MKPMIVNPYLPCWEYVPDGEPRVFGNRLYLFGSHDAFAGERFCVNDYVCWSAPLDDLSRWHCHGVMYRKDQDPMNDGSRVLYAPDVVQGKDGKYYLYYTLDLLGSMSVAVAERPEGPYTYYGAVRDAKGHVLGQRAGDIFQYDPGVLVDENGYVHLYTGVAAEGGPLERKLADRPRVMDGAYHMKLAPDMLTLCEPPRRIAPGYRAARGTPFEEHAFFEASSIRKVGERYYFIYSSVHSHELCYATCDQPDGAFTYGGVIISIGDIGLEGRRLDCEATNHLGTTHGSIVCVRGQWYVFYHRQTNDNQLSRQGCAEKIQLKDDGSIAQVEVTSCGLNDGWLPGTGCYEARIACNLAGVDGPRRYQPYRTERSDCPYFTQDEPDDAEHATQYIANMRRGSWAGFKYFDMDGANRIRARFRAEHGGWVKVAADRQGAPVAVLRVPPCQAWTEVSAALAPLQGKTALYFTFEGEGELAFLSFTLEHC